MQPPIKNPEAGADRQGNPALHVTEDTQPSSLAVDSQQGSDNARDVAYLHGRRFALMVTGTCLALFIASIDTTITVTSIVAITDDLGGFQRASCVLSAYQLGWVAIMVVNAKFSEIFGRKAVFIGNIFLFAIFSGGCAASQTMEQLIVLRALEGVGGGGCFAITMILILEAVPADKLGAFAPRMNIPLIVSLVLGPLLGGVISSHTTWRWIFLINIPICAAAILFVVLGVPNGYPYHEHPGFRLGHTAAKPKFSKIDAVGTVLVPRAALSFTAAFQEAGSRFAWNSAYFITLITTPTALWVVLLLWERYVTIQDSSVEPVLPWRFFTSRFRIGLLLGFVFVGVPMLVINFQLPQRLQLINGLSGTDAGVRIIPFGVAFCIGSFLSSKLTEKLRVPSIYQILFGSLFQTVGCVLLSRLDSSPRVNPALYGYQVLCGIGIGLNYMAMYLLIPIIADQRDKAVGSALASQARIMGSAFGLAVTTAVFNGYAKPRLDAMGSANTTNLGRSMASDGLLGLPPDVQVHVRTVLSEAYNRQMLVLCGFAAAQFPAALMLWKQVQIVV